MAAVVGLAVGVPVAGAMASGAFDIPRVDDWAYAHAAVDLERTLHVHLVGWGEMMLVGHLLWGVPFAALFGGSISVMHWAGATAAALGLLITYLLARQFLSQGRALLVTAVIGALPAFAFLSATYMTDLTSYLAEVGCLLAGIAALRAGGRRRAAWLFGLSLLIGFWGFTVRESAIAAPVAVLGGHLVRALRRPGRARTITTAAVLGAGIGLAGAAVAAYAWRHSLPNDQRLQSPPGAFDRFKALAAELNGYFTLSLSVAPLLLVGARERVSRVRGSRAGTAAALAVGVAGLAALLVTHYPARTSFTVLLGGGLMKPGPALAGARQDLFSAPAWAALNVIAVLAGAAVAGVLVAAAAPTLRAVRIRPGPVGQAIRHALCPGRPALAGLAPSLVVLLGYGAASALLLIFRTLGGHGLFDRYFLGLALVLSILLLRRGGGGRPPPERGRSLAIAGLALVPLALVSWLVILDSDAFDVARWSAALRAQRAGVPPEQIGAGFEWLGAHLNGRPPTTSIISPYGRCVLLTGGRLPGPRLELLETPTYAPVDHVLQRRIWVYRDARVCARVAAAPGPSAG